MPAKFIATLISSQEHPPECFCCHVLQNNFFHKLCSLYVCFFMLSMNIHVSLNIYLCYYMHIYRRECIVVSSRVFTYPKRVFFFYFFFFFFSRVFTYSKRSLCFFFTDYPNGRNVCEQTIFGSGQICLQDVYKKIRP